MRKQVIAAVFTTLFITPAQARDGSFYVGLEGGVTFPRRQAVDASIDYTTTTSPPASLIFPPGPADRDADNALRSSWQSGYDVDAVAGYDFGRFRLEAELGYKRAKRKALRPSDGFLASFNEDLREPLSFGFSELPLLTKGDFAVGGDTVSVVSEMVNALLDIEAAPRLSLYGGAGGGRAGVKELGNSRGVFAWQVIAGVRYELSPKIELGLKYRKFRTSSLEIEGATTTFEGIRGYGTICGDPNFFGRPCTLRQAITADLSPRTRGGFRSQSVLATLTFNFGRPSQDRH